MDYHNNPKNYNLETQLQDIEGETMSQQQVLDTKQHTEKKSGLKIHKNLPPKFRAAYAISFKNHEKLYRDLKKPN